MVNPVVRLDLNFQGRMLATWHSFGDGLYYPALLGGLGEMKLVYVVLQDGVCPGFSTWREARDVAAAAKLVSGSWLCRIEASDDLA